LKVQFTPPPLELGLNLILQENHVFLSDTSKSRMFKAQNSRDYLTINLHALSINQAITFVFLKDQMAEWLDIVHRENGALTFSSCCL